MYYLYETSVGLSLYKIKDDKVKFLKSVMFDGPQEAADHQNLTKVTAPLQKIIDEVLHLQSKKDKKVKLQLSCEEVAEFIRSEFGLKTTTTKTVAGRRDISKRISQYLAENGAEPSLTDRTQTNLFSSSQLARLQL